MDPHEPMLVDPVPADQPQSSDDLAHLATQHGDGRLVKMDVDYTKQVDEALPKADTLLQSGNLSGALDSLAYLEKQSRLGSDMKSNARILEHMVKMCFEAKNWQLLNDTILVLSKKRSLIKFAIARMVRVCVEMVDKMPTEDERNKLIETLRTVTAGKIYVEVDRARLTQRLVKKLESEGKLNEACDMLLELQVETYGSMQMQEKIAVLLDQMRLSVARKDFVRASIISKKISTRFFDGEKKEDDTVQDLKLKYYDYMVQIGLHEEAYLDVCRYYRAMFETPKIQKDSAKSACMLKHAVLFVLLSTHDNEQWQLLHLIHQERKLEEVEQYKNLLELFIGEEIISWRETIVKNYEVTLRTSDDVKVFAPTTEGDKRYKAFQARVGEHNIRMVSKYYTQISFDRMAELLDYDVNEMETFLCNLIVTGVIPEAKIDRKERIIHMRARKANVEQLDQWGHSVHKLTDILNKVSHLILKEEMVHRHLEGK
uniref:PCI domain-containing protein n=1 Tax=Steinernema glaseri TaxID=37863 RepID=A0A1I7Z2V4_9BILA